MTTLAALIVLAATDPKAELVDVRRIGDAAPHNAFTDLVRHRGHWFCTFREGQAHVSPDGAIRVLHSADGVKWESAARLTSATADLRDPKMSAAPDGRLMLLAGAALHRPAGHTHESYVWFSDDGRAWGEPVRVAAPGDWLWRVTWHKGTAYGVGYATKGKGVRLYRGADGRTFTPLVDR